MKEYDAQLQNSLTVTVRSKYVQLAPFWQDLSNMMKPEGLWLSNDLKDS